MQGNPHSASHPARLSHCPPAIIRREWHESRSRIADVIGAEVSTGSVPGGFYSRAVGQIAAQCGLRVLFTSEPTVRPHRLDQMLVMVTNPLEQEVNTVPGLDHVSSITSRGTAEVDLFFTWNVDMFQTLELVNAALARVQPTLPANTKVTASR